MSCYTLTGHSNSVWSVAVNPTGKFFASGSEDKTVILWDIDKRESTRTLECDDPAYTVHFDPTGQFLAIGFENDGVKIWDLQNHTWITCLDPHNGVTELAWGDSLAVVGDDNIKLWDVTTQQLVSELSLNASSAKFISSHLLAIGLENSNIVVLDARLGNTVATMIDHTADVVSLSQSSSLLASGSTDCTAKLWDMRTFACVETFFGHSGEVRAICFNTLTNGLITGSTDNTIRVWNSAREDRVIREHKDSVNSLCFDPKSGFIVSGSFDETIRLWSTNDEYSYDYTSIPVINRSYGEIIQPTQRDKSLYRLLETYLPSELAVMGL